MAQYRCGGELSSPSGSITSPSYPQPYHHQVNMIGHLLLLIIGLFQAECLWKIKVGAGSRCFFSSLRQTNCFNNGSDLIFLLNHFLELYEVLFQRASLMPFLCLIM